MSRRHVDTADECVLWYCGARKRGMAQDDALDELRRAIARKLDSAETSAHRVAEAKHSRELAEVRAEANSYREMLEWLLDGGCFRMTEVLEEFYSAPSLGQLAALRRLRNRQPGGVAA